MASNSKASPLRQTVSEDGKDLQESELRRKPCFHIAIKHVQLKFVPIEAFQKQQRPFTEFLLCSMNLKNIH